MKSIRSTDIAMLFLRISVGTVMVFAGCQKVFGWFGGAGYQATLASFAKLGITNPFAIIAMAAMLLGGLGLLFGVLTRVAAFGVACTMAFAAYKMAMLPSAYEKLMSGDHQGASTVGYPFVLFTAALSIVLIGGGRMCLDRLVLGKKKGGK
jgi:putative oxidoreductase